MAVPSPVALSEPMPTVDAARGEFEAAVREHARLVYKVAYSVLRNHHDAEDAAQETFVRFLRHQKDWPGIRDLRAWLARAAWRVAVDRTRRVQEIPLEEAAEAVGEMRAAGAAPDEIAANQQMSALLANMVRTLPRALRDTLALSMVDELSSPEIAELLSISEGSVRERLWRARQILREKLSAVLESKRTT